MSQTQQAAKAPPREGVWWKDSTIFLCPDDIYEVKIAQEYLKAQYPGTPARLVSEIPVDRLLPQHVIVPLYRVRGCSEALKTIRHTNGTESLEYVPPRNLAEEVYEAPPLEVKSCWNNTVRADPDGSMAFESVSGQVDTHQLLRGISSRLQDPVSIKAWRSDVRKLKIGS